MSDRHSIIGEYRAVADVKSVPVAPSPAQFPRALSLACEALARVGHVFSGLPKFAIAPPLSGDLLAAFVPVLASHGRTARPLLAAHAGAVRILQSTSIFIR